MTRFSRRICLHARHSKCTYQDYYDHLDMARVQFRRNYDIDRMESANFNVFNQHSQLLQANVHLTITICELSFLEDSTPYLMSSMFHSYPQQLITDCHMGTKAILFLDFMGLAMMVAQRRCSQGRLSMIFIRDLQCSSKSHHYHYFSLLSWNSQQDTLPGIGDP